MLVIRCKFINPCDCAPWFLAGNTTAERHLEVINRCISFCNSLTQPPSDTVLDAVENWTEETSNDTCGWILSCVWGLLKALGECWGVIEGRGIHKQGHKVQLRSHISPQEYQQGKADSAGGRPSPPIVIIYNGEHDSSIWGTGKVATFKLGDKKSKHQHC